MIVDVLCQPGQFYSIKRMYVHVLLVDKQLLRLGQNYLADSFVSEIIDHIHSLILNISYILANELYIL